MQFMPKMPPEPCVRCTTRLVKSGGITGMCVACRAADPVMAQERRDEHARVKALMRQSMDDFLETQTVPDPHGRPGVRLAKPGASFAKAARIKGRTYRV